MFTYLELEDSESNQVNKCHVRGIGGLIVLQFVAILFLGQTVS